MRVQEIVIDNKKRFVLLNDKNELNIPVTKYLKHLDNTGKKSKTLKTYCYALKLYFEFLEENDKKFDDVQFADLSDFVGWLRNPNKKITYLFETDVKQRSEKTVNLVITIVTSFYDFLYREEMFNVNIKDELERKTHSKKKRYKEFLTHIQGDKERVKNSLLLKVPKKKITVLTKAEINKIYNACNNLRDKFLIKVLYETGFRIGEVLSLHIEDFEFDPIEGHKIHLKDRGELENGASLKSGERSVNVSEELMEMFDDYLMEILDDLETSFVFVKLVGENKGEAMNYTDINSLMKRLSKKTGIKVNAHLFRHTHATYFYQKTKNIKATQERLGHADIQTTMNMYVHPSDEEKRKEWESAQSEFDLDFFIEENEE